MYQRILLAYDGSLEGRAALREGALMAKICGAQVFLLSVVSDGTGTRIAGGVDASAVVQQQENYQAVLEDGVARLKMLGFAPEAKLVTGEPAREIGSFADQVGADLVVVGHRKQSVFGRWWSGANGAYLVDHIHCSLLVGRNVITDEAFKAELQKAGQSAS